MRKISALALSSLICCSAVAAVNPGDVAPDDLGKTIEGVPVLPSAFRGKVVVISFWATWCHYCLKELPILGGLQELSAKRGLPMQVVAVDDQEPREVFRRVAKLLQPKLPSLLLTWDRNGAIRRSYADGDGIPVMVMLHRNGTVAHVHVGYDEKELDGIVAEINTLLNEPAVPATPVASTEGH